jgi:MFS family permease
MSVAGARLTHKALREVVHPLSGKTNDYDPHLELAGNTSLCLGTASAWAPATSALPNKFLPKHLEALGATTPIIGLFGTAEDFFDACYQYPGGFVADRFGRRRAFLFFIILASLGYLVYLFSTSWPFLFLSLKLVMSWQSIASPAIFAVIGDSLPRERRAMGFTLQSILKRVPIMIAPIVGGFLIASLGRSTVSTLA